MSGVQFGLKTQTDQNPISQDRPVEGVTLSQLACLNFPKVSIQVQQVLLVVAQSVGQDFKSYHHAGQ